MSGGVAELCYDYRLTSTTGVGASEHTAAAARLRDSALEVTD
jgi:hypothetical protein